MTAFNQGFNLLKRGEAIAEFGGNDICPECGTKMKQRYSQLAYNYPVVYGWDCPKCEYFRPHDWEHAMTENPPMPLCGKCKGTGEQDEYNRKLDSLECDWCNGTGWWSP